jgi:hypothetical protein
MRGRGTMRRWGCQQHEQYPAGAWLGPGPSLGRIHPVLPPFACLCLTPPSPASSVQLGAGQPGCCSLTPWGQELSSTHILPVLPLCKPCPQLSQALDKTQVILYCLLLLDVPLPESLPRLTTESRVRGHPVPPPASSSNWVVIVPKVPNRDLKRAC